MNLREKVIQAIDKAVDQNQTIDSVGIASHVMEVVEQENQIGFAEQQLLGYAMAKTSNIDELIESMGLTRNEWNRLKNTPCFQYLSDYEVGQIEVYFNNKKL